MREVAAAFEDIKMTMLCLCSAGFAL